MCRYTLDSTPWIAPGISLTWHKMIIASDVLTVEEGLAQVQPRLGPLHIEVEGESDGIVFVVDLEDVGDLDACED